MRGTGRQDLFPFDWYKMSGAFSIDLVEPFCLLEVTDKDQQDSRALEGDCPAGLNDWTSHPPVGHQVPLRVEVEAEPSMQGRKIQATQSSFGMPTNEVFAEVLIERDGSVRLYTTIMSLIPLALSVLFIHTLFLSAEQRTNMIEAVPAIAAAVLAVLPIRSILVPSEIQGINTVDVFLGIGLIAIVGTLFTKDGWEVWRRDSN